MMDPLDLVSFAKRAWEQHNQPLTRRGLPGTEDMTNQGLLGMFSLPALANAVAPVGEYEDGSTGLAWPEIIAGPAQAWGRMMETPTPAVDDDAGWDQMSRDSFDAAGGAMTGGFAAGVGGGMVDNALGSAGGRVAASKPDLPLATNALERQPQGIRAYHGTGRELDGGRFDPSQAHVSAGLGPHFGTVEQANNFARNRSQFGNNGGQVYPVDLDFKNPVDLPDLYTWEPSRIAGEIEQRYPQYNGLIDAVDNARAKLKAPSADWFDTDEGLLAKLSAEKDALREAMLESGIDGIRYQNKMNSEGVGQSYMALKPGTVRSATTGDLLYSNAPTGAAIPAGMEASQGEQDPALFEFLRSMGLI